MKKIFLLSLLFIVTYSCNNSNKSDYSAFEIIQKANNHPGKKLMETNCYTCHSPEGSHDKRIGPPMIAIKKHYINENTTKEEFVASMQAWIKNPNEEDAKMFGAVKRFGVMPKQTFPEETIVKIAEYMYVFEIEQPEWFEDHFNEDMGKGKGRNQSQKQN